MPVSIALVGIGGYGEVYLDKLLPVREEKDIRLVAGIDPQAERSSRITELQEAGIPIYPGLEQFYKRDTADLVIVSAPIHFHAPLTCMALANGSNVLCEKPLAGSLADARVMQEAERSAGKFVAIGYQWSFSEAVLGIKQDILSGILGQPLEFKTAVLWPRRTSYYRRNAWAGKVRAQDGAWILDSPVNNAAAHYLHHMLFLLGNADDRSAEPASMEAELYRANDIENYDTAALHIVTGNGANLLFLTAHSVDKSYGPLLHLEFDKAVVEYPGDNGTFQAKFRNGEVKSYGSPDSGEANKLWGAVEAVRTGKPPLCGIQAASPHLVCTAAAQQAPIHRFPQRLIHIQDEYGEDPLVYVDGLFEDLLGCYHAGCLPSQRPGIAWAHAKTAVDLSQVV